jgi:hypothetical protein
MLPTLDSNGYAAAIFTGTVIFLPQILCSFVDREAAWALQLERIITPFSVSGVVWMPSEYCKCPVELFGEHDAGEFVGQRHWAQRQQHLCLPWRLLRPAARRPNGKDDRLLSGIASHA